MISNLIICFTLVFIFFGFRKGNLFSLKGIMNRKYFLFNLLILLVLLYYFLGYISWAKYHPDLELNPDPFLANLDYIYFSLFFIIIFRFVAIITRRFRTIGTSGWWSLIYLIPFIMLFFSFFVINFSIPIYTFLVFTIFLSIVKDKKSLIQLFKKEI